MNRIYQGNYLWIQLFYSALKERSARDAGGRAGFVMAKCLKTKSRLAVTGTRAHSAQN